MGIEYVIMHQHIHVYKHGFNENIDTVFTAGDPVQGEPTVTQFASWVMFLPRLFQDFYITSLVINFMKSLTGVFYKHS